MKFPRLALLAVLAAWPAAAWSAEVTPPVELPGLSAPLSAPVVPAAFPVATAPQFLSGARAVVDLGGDAYGHWSRDLAAAQPQTSVQLVNVQPLEPVLSHFQERGLSNLQGSQYDFFSPPPGHPTGDRVLLNSPNFGGLPTAKSVDNFVDMIDAHLQPGGLFYAHADDLLYASLQELKVAAYLGTTMSGEIDARHARVLAALKRRFGEENVSEQPLRGYDPEGKLNAINKFNLQVRKPTWSDGQ